MLTPERRETTLRTKMNLIIFIILIVLIAFRTLITLLTFITLITLITLLLLKGWVWWNRTCAGLICLLVKRRIRKNTGERI